ncbi:MAG: bacteriohemerythrin [Nitrospirota bacterium]
MEWNESFATGIKEIDDQHKEIFKEVGWLLDACRHGKGQEKIGDMVRFLGEYVSKHFWMEETLQQINDFPLYQEHKAMHAEFTRDFTKLREEFEEKGATLNFIHRINTLVIDWLVHHITREDKKIAEFIKNKKAA